VGERAGRGQSAKRGNEGADVALRGGRESVARPWSGFFFFLLLCYHLLSTSTGGSPLVVVINDKSVGLSACPIRLFVNEERGRGAIERGRAMICGNLTVASLFFRPPPPAGGFFLFFFCG
jgi:hypothetical protein